MRKYTKLIGTVYNIITDFVLALYPWLVTWNLRIRKLEKILMCATMSLGVVVASIAAWRTAYMMSEAMNGYNAGYFQRQGLTMVWYIGEVAGTIIVQTLPMIRHLVRDRTAQVSLVSMELNEVSTTTTMCWSGTKPRPGQDEEKGLTRNGCKPLRELRLHWKPPARRESWSTYTQPGWSSS